MEEELLKLTVVKLREKLAEKGLDIKGVKAVLVKRLLEVAHNETNSTESGQSVTEDGSAVLEPSVPPAGDPSDEERKTAAAEPPDSEQNPESTAEVDSAEPEAAVGVADRDESMTGVRRAAVSPIEDVEPKRQKLDISNDEDISRDAQSETTDKMFLSLIGDEPTEKEADNMSAEQMLTDQEENSLLGEEPAKVLDSDKPQTEAAESAANSSQSLLDSGHDTSQEATAPRSSEEDAEKPVPMPDEIAPDAREAASELGQATESTAKGSETAGDAIDATRKSHGRESSSRATRQKASENAAENKNEWIDKQRTTITLDEYTSDLNCSIDAETMSIVPLSESYFAWMCAGVKCSHGFIKGKIRRAFLMKLLFDVKVLELLDVDIDSDEKHLLRVGFCRRLDHQSARLGEDEQSWALSSSGKKGSGGDFEGFAELPDLKVGDVFSSMLNLDTCPAELRFAHNGKDLGVAFEIPPGSHALYPAVLTKNIKVEVNLGQAEALPVEGCELEHIFPLKTEPSNRVKDDIAPYSRRESELIMMIGLPSSGKSTWARRHVEKHPEKHYNVLGISTILDRMIIEGKPEAKKFSGDEDELSKMTTSCLSKLIETAASRRRNIILDDSNVKGSVQVTRWRLFDGFKRRAVILITTAETLKERHAKRSPEEHLLSDKTISEMKACLELPYGSHFRGCLTFAELSRDDAEREVEKYNEEAAKELGIEPRRKRRQPNRGAREGEASTLARTGARCAATPQMPPVLAGHVGVCFRSNSIHRQRELVTQMPGGQALDRITETAVKEDAAAAAAIIGVREPRGSSNLIAAVVGTMKAMIAAPGSRFGSQVESPRVTPSYNTAQKPWAAHPQAAQPQPQHESTPHCAPQSTWTSTQNPQPYNQPQQQTQEQQQQWYQWQQFYNDPRARPSAQNAEQWKGHNQNQWLTTPAPGPAVSDSSPAETQKPYQATQLQANQRNQWTYWQQWQQRPAGSQQTVAAAPGSQYSAAQQYQQQMANWKQQCSRYYEQNPQIPHQSQHK
ncbi:heterogeneous nuclear ribonucleoprotein U-like protein 2 [Galendromus occidentalis]|uniref:Heterogeneous nuclear ribonucleoprotein U-like protein 2 n=1 Tax=Galendromus occidentalis TaxID=34638 RepID=A0AAJ7WI99_9ACAR|nr:heterogeneous nuclear ribonucleoprotein U-like protein 2 [Galendromus occidentalis]